MTNSRITIWLLSSVTPWPVVRFNHIGVSTKHSVFVSRVTINETASLPRALRVHTEAAARVQGTVPATIKPI